MSTDRSMPWLSALTGPVRNAVQNLYQRLIANESRLDDLEKTVLKTGSPIVAYGQRIQKLADPKDPGDAVNLASLRRIVASEIAVGTKEYKRPTKVPVPGGSNPGYPTNPLPSEPPVTSLPNYAHVVEAYVAANPGQVANSCQDAGGTWDFMDGLVDELRKYDQRFGYNAKRGDLNDPSHDALAYYAGPGLPYEGATPVFIVDILLGHCGPDPSAAWIDQTEASRVNGVVQGAWISRSRLSVSTVPPAGGLVRASGGGFTINGSPVKFIGCSMFTLFYDWAFGGRGATVMQSLAAMKQTDIRMPRVLVTLNADYWTNAEITGVDYGVRLDPDEHADFYVKLGQFAALLTGEGFYPEYVVFGDCHDGFETQAIRTTVTQNVAGVLKHYPCFVQIANEPPGISIGREGSNYFALDPFAEAQRLAGVYKGVDRANPVSAFATQSVQPADSQLTRTIASPSDWGAYHSSRNTGDGKWEWITDTIINTAVRRNGQPVPVVDDEPMCASGNPDNNQNDADPVHWWAYGCLVDLLGIGSVFHSQELLASQFTHGAHWAQLQAWLEGRARVGVRTPGTEFYIKSNGYAFGAGPYASTNALAVYGRINGGTGLALALNAPGGFDVSSSLNPGWSATVIESRGSAVLIALSQ